MYKQIKKLNGLFFNAILFFLVLLASCRSSKELIHKVETNQSDTLILKTEVVKTPPILSSITINQLCDSITGKVKDYDQEFVVAGDTIRLSIENNRLTLDIKKLETDFSRLEKQYRTAIKDRNESIKNTRTIVVWTKWTWIFLMWAIVATAALVYLLWDKISNIFGWAARILGISK